MYIKYVFQIINYENLHKFLTPNVSGADKRGQQKMEEQHNKTISTSSLRLSCLNKSVRYYFNPRVGHVRMLI